MGLEFLGLNGGLIQFDINKLSSKKEESFKDFLWEDASWFTQFAKKLHYKNPGKCKIFVKKSWLDNSSKLIFKNLETIFSNSFTFSPSIRDRLLFLRTLITAFISLLSYTAFP